MSGPTNVDSQGFWTPPTIAELQAALPPFEILEQLGEGGMGAVYRARQSSLDRIVAIKVLPPALTSGDHATLKLDERFKREARTLAKLDHPGITTVHDFGEAPGGFLYIVMEFIDGMDLHGYLHHCGGQLPMDEVLYVGLHVLEALDYAHTRGVLHRDIKPANILVRRDDGAVKLVDFGLAKILDSGEDPAAPALTLSHVAVGTPDFVPPEAMVSGTKPDVRGDIFSLGITLYLLITGRIPKGKVSSVSGMVAHIDPRFDAVIDRAIEMVPEKRYQNAAEFHAALDAFAEREQRPSSSLRSKLTQGGYPITGDSHVPKVETPREVVLTGDDGATPAQGPPTPPAPASKTIAVEIPKEKRLPKGRIAAVATASIAVLALFALRPWTDRDLIDLPSPPPSSETSGSSISTKTPSSSPSGSTLPGPLAASELPTDGVVRAWGRRDGLPINVNGIATALGPDTRYQRILSGANDWLVAVQESGDGRTLNIGQPENAVKADRVEWIDRDNHAWLTNGQLDHDETVVDPDVSARASTDRLLSGGLFGYFYLDEDGRVQLHGWEKAPGGRQPMEEILAALEEESVKDLSYVYLGAFSQGLTVLTSDNRLRSWRIEDDYQIHEVSIEPPDEPIAEIAFASNEFGWWVARAESGNVYSDGTGGFAKPIEALSPAVALRSDEGIVATQNLDGTWRAMGRSGALVEAIESIGVAADLDFFYSKFTSQGVFWLDPDGGRSHAEIAAAMPSVEVRALSAPQQTPPTRGFVRVRSEGAGGTIDAAAVEAAFGTETSYQEIVIGHDGVFLALDAAGRGTIVQGDSPNDRADSWQVSFLDRQNHAWVSEGTLFHGAHVVDPQVSVTPDRLLVAGLFGYLHRNESGAPQVSGWDTVPDGLSNQPPIGGRATLQQILDQLAEETLLSLDYASLQLGRRQRVAALTADNRLRVFIIEEDGQVRETRQENPREPIAQLFNGGHAFGDWLALAESGNVYSLGTGGFTKPVEVLSPAWKLRNRQGIAAAQQRNGTWIAMGGDETLKDKIESIGPAADLDFFRAGDDSLTVAWLEPDPADLETTEAAPGSPPTLDAGVPRSGYIRIWSTLAETVFEEEFLHEAFGATTPYRELYFGHRHLIGFDRTGEARLVRNGRSGVTRSRELEILDRSQLMWRYDGAFSGVWHAFDGDYAPPPNSQPVATTKRGYIYRDENGELQWVEPDGKPDTVATAFEQILDEVEELTLSDLQVFEGGTVHITALTEDDVIHSWSIRENGSVVLDTFEGSEPIAELLHGGYDLGGWVARAESGNIYAESASGLRRPIPELSPAVKARTHNGVIAVQRRDGTWKAMGRAKQLIEKIEEIGPAYDLGFTWSGAGETLVWLAPEV